MSSTTTVDTYMVASDHYEPVNPLNGSAVVKVLTGGTVYYADKPYVTATSNQGSLTVGQSATFTGPAWLLSASLSSVSVTITGAADDTTLDAAAVATAEAASVLRDGTGMPGSVVSVPSGSGAGGAIAAGRGTGNAGVAVLRDVVSILDFSGADRTGVSDSATALKNALTEAAALAVGGYGATQGVAVHVPGGRWLLGSKIQIPPGITLIGDGFNSTVFQIPTVFPDNAAIEPTNIDGTQEYAGLQGFMVQGQGFTTPSSNQANAGSASTVATTISNPINVPAFNLVVTGTGLGYASNGTLLVGGTKRIVYQSLTEAGGNTTFHSCWITSGYGTSFGGGSGLAINAGDTVTAVTTNNVVGIRLAGLGATSLLRDVFVGYTTSNCIQILWCNCLDVQNVWANFSNRDCILADAQFSHSWLRSITAQYPDAANTGAGFACVHLRGASSNAGWQGNLNVHGLYMEMTSDNAIGLWLDNINNISADNIRLVGGTAKSTHVMVQIDSAQASPTTQDGQHSGNLKLTNLLSGGNGRVTLKDNVRGYTTPANTGGVGTALTEYTTESLGPIGFVSRPDTLRRGTLPAFADSFDFRYMTTSSNFDITPVSGTQQGGIVPLLGGVSYNKIVFYTGATGATWGSNNDGLWYVAIYDPSGNLVTQTTAVTQAGGAGAGANGLASGQTVSANLNSAFSPAVDGSYQVVVMIYLGTGGSPVIPKLKGLVNIVTSIPASGMPRIAFSANATQTSGTALGTIGTLAGTGNLIYFGVYHT